MNWINWHTPSITPAEAFYAVLVVAAIHVVVSVVLAFLREPERVNVEEQDEQIHGDRAWPVRREL